MLRRNSKRLKLTLLAGLVAAAAPLAYGAYELVQLDANRGAVEQAARNVETTREAVDAISQAIVGFTAIAVDVGQKDREEIISETERSLAPFQNLVRRIRDASPAPLPDPEWTQLFAAVDSLMHSWDEVWSHRQKMEPEEAAFHFVSILESSKAARVLLQKLERETTRLSQLETNAFFERSQRDMRGLMLLVLLTAIVGVGCTLAMFAAAERERRASDSLRRTDEALHLQSARFEAAIENMSQGLCMFDEHRKLVVSNRRYATLYRIDPALLTRGTPVEKVLEYRVAAGAAPRDAAAYVAGRLQEAHKNQAYKVEHELLDGRVIAVSHEPLPDGGWVATHEDITEQKRAETRIAHMAHHDALTGLPNRVVLAQRLRELLDDDENPAFAVLALDLDLFKRVNDTLGHQYGDLLLGQVAQRLRDSTRETDLVVRLGGDEFAIVQLAEDQPDSATALSERVIAVLNQPFDLDGHQIVIGTSIGVALSPNDGDDPYTLLKNADLALYRAKSDGRNVCRYFERTMDARMQARRLLEVDLRKALAEDELELVYQPILAVENRRIVGFEALLR